MLYSPYQIKSLADRGAAHISTPAATERVILWEERVRRRSVCSRPGVDAGPPENIRRTVTVFCGALSMADRYLFGYLSDLLDRFAGGPVFLPREDHPGGEKERGKKL